MAQIVSKGQASTGRLIEVVMVAFAAAAFVLVIAWAAFVASAPSADTSSRTTTQYLQEPGLVDQRRGEHGVDAATAPGGSLLTPEMQEHRRSERATAKWETYGREWLERYGQMYPVLD